MTIPYKPRKKKTIKVVKRMKLVRVDWRTQIEVPVNIPDNVAIDRYYALHTTAVRPVVDEVEVLSAIVDDANLPETE